MGLLFRGELHRAYNSYDTDLFIFLYTIHKIVEDLRELLLPSLLDHGLKKSHQVIGNSSFKDIFHDL